MGIATPIPILAPIESPELDPELGPEPGLGAGSVGDSINPMDEALSTVVVVAFCGIVPLLGSTRN